MGKKFDVYLHKPYVHFGITYQAKFSKNEGVLKMESI